MFFPGWSCLEFSVHGVNIGNSMILCGIWHKYHSKLLYKPLGEWNWRQFWNISSGIYAKYHVQIMLLFAYTTTLKRFVIFTCRYFKLSWNTTTLIQSNCRNFSCSSIINIIGDYKDNDSGPGWSNDRSFFQVPCGTRFLQEFIFADWRIFFFGN